MQQTVLIFFVTLMIVLTYGSTQEVAEEDLELSETKFKKYYIHRHDSGYGGCDDGMCSLELDFLVINIEILLLILSWKIRTRCGC